MKKKLLSALCLATMLLSAQEEKTLSLGASSANDVFYSLANGELASTAGNNWDLAFEISGWTASIRVNTANGIGIWESEFGAEDWETFSDANKEDWESLYNSETSWNEGALNHNSSGDSDLGWGTYNFVTHVVSGDHIYLIQLQDETYRKLLIEKLESGVYHFKYAALDGTAEETVAIAKDDYEGKNFAYYSIENTTAIDREPVTNEWDLIFGKYTAMLGDIPYPVTGVRSNASIDVAEAAGVDVSSVSHEDYEMLSDDISVIGYDWKSFDGSGYQIQEDLCFFVKDHESKIYKLVFTGYSGSSTGTIEFTQELIGSAVGLNETQASVLDFTVYPNPSNGNDINVLYEWTKDQQAHARLQLRNSIGKIVWAQEVSGAAGFYQQEIPGGLFESGLYLLELNSGADQWHQKVIIY